MKRIEINGPVTIVVPDGTEVTSEPIDWPMYALMYALPKNPNTGLHRHYGWVLPADQVEAKVWFEHVAGNVPVAMVEVPEGRFDPLPEGTDTGNVDQTVLNACWWYSDKTPPPAAGYQGDRWGQLAKPSNSDLGNGSEARVVVKAGQFQPLPKGVPKFFAPFAVDSPED